MGSENFECAHCHGVFKKGRTDEEALAEAEANGWNLATEEMAVICDTCYQAMVEIIYPPTPVQRERR